MNTDRKKGSRGSKGRGMKQGSTGVKKVNNPLCLTS